MAPVNSSLHGPAQTDGGTLTAIAIDRAGNNGPATEFSLSGGGLALRPAITAIEDDVRGVPAGPRRAAPQDDTTRALRGTTDIGSPLKFSLM